MATFRKRYRSKNRRRNTRKSHIKKRGKKILVGGTDPVGTETIRTDTIGTDATFTKEDMLKIVTEAVTRAREAMKAAIVAEEKAALAAETSTKSAAPSNIKNGVNIVVMMMKTKFNKDNENINIEKRDLINTTVTRAAEMMREKTAFTREDVIQIANTAVRDIIRDTIGVYLFDPDNDVLDDLSEVISSNVDTLANIVIKKRALIAAKTAAKAVLNNIR